MPAWLITILIKVVLPVILADLVKSGMMSEAGAIAVRYGVDFDQFLKTIKFSAKPEDFPQPPPGQTNQHNFTTGAGPEQ